MLSVNNIQVYYHDVVQALRGLSLEAPKGKIVALLGSNGAGKSTALKAISGLLPLENGAITEGEVKFDGATIAKVEPHMLTRRGMAHVREGRRIFADLTVEENLIAATYALEGRNAKAEYDMVYSMFPRLKERERQIAGYLSGGEQQMLAVGRALIGKPSVILMDEPSLGLAPLVAQEIFKVVKRINEEQGATILLVEQNASLAFSIADFAYIMESGRVMTEGEVSKLKNDKDVQEFSPGMGGGETRKSFRDVKHYKRRKRWLS